MRKKSLLALLLVAALALSGCSLVVKDEAVDAARVIIDVNGETKDKQTVNAMIDYQLAMMAQNYYNNYGYQIDTTSAEARESMTTSVVDSYVNSMVVDQKIKELGYNVFSEEEEAEIKASAEEEYNQNLDLIKMVYLSASENEGDALTEEAKTYAENNGMSLESMIESARLTKSEEKLKNEVVKDVAVTDEEIKAQYDANVASAKTSYETNVSAYGTSVNGGSTVYYAPKGYRYVKQVLVKLAAEDSTKISSINTELTAANSTLTSTTKALADNETALAAEGITEEEKASLTQAQPALKTAVEEAQAKVDELTAQLDEVSAKAYADAKVKADEIYQKALDGADFEALIEEYNEDPGMTTEPGKTNGYAVCEGYTPFEASFVEAAMALKAVGDVSEPTKGSSGYYIIRYQGDIAEGEVELSAVSEGIKASLLATKQNEAYSAAIAEWVKAANVKTYPNRLD